MAHNRTVKEQIEFLKILIKFSEREIVSKDGYANDLFIQQTARLKKQLADLKGLQSKRK